VHHIAPAGHADSLSTAAPEIGLAGRAGGTRGGSVRRPKVLAYVALTKPRIIELLLITTVPTMIVAERGLPSWWLMFATVAGGTLAAGGANAMNMYVDRDIDQVMRRTQARPLVTGEITPPRALAFAIGIEVAAFVWLWGFVNLLSACLAVSACLFYVFVYTLWLKRSSTSNIVIGGAAGAVPVLVGWAAVRNSLAWTPVVLFAVIFYWTPPHFWALAIKYRDDYAAADVPMLPVVAGLRRTAVRIVGYTIVLWGLTVLLGPVAGLGLTYMVSANVLGAVFLALCVWLVRAPSPKLALRVFSFSITYLTLLFVAMAVDQLLLSGL
jgi:protoheme IX farnesyltransferase